ncbi:MAG: acyl-CoA dehydrogenase family protein [Kineosporiaceae bacterium]
MSIGTDDEPNTLAAAVADFCRKEVGTVAERDRLTDGGFEVHSPLIARKMADLGWLGIAIPTEFGGSGGGLVDLCSFLDAANHGLAPIGAYPTSAIVGSWYLRFGSPEQKATILGGIAAGRVESLALSEPGSGSDVAGARCRADRIDDGFVLNGQKSWCSNAHLADHLLVLARTDDTGDRHAGLTLFQVPADAPGVEIRPIRSLAGAELNEVFLTDCHVPRSAVVGLVGQGWLQVMSGLTFERLVISAAMLGLARRAFDDVLQFVKEREQFGQPVGTFQAVRHRCADLATELECCRLLVYDAARSADRDRSKLPPQRAAMVKLKVTETARRTTLEAMQLMGAAGVSSEYGLERAARMALLSTIYGGTSEIQRELIGKGLGL